MSKKRYPKQFPETTDEFLDDTQIETVEEEELEPEPEVVEEPAVVTTCRGIVTDCLKLNVRVEPSKDAAIVCEINRGTEVIINEQNSTDDFYMIYIASGVEGFCMKQYISIQ